MESSEMKCSTCAAPTTWLCTECEAQGANHDMEHQHEDQHKCESCAMICSACDAKQEDCTCEPTTM